MQLSSQREARWHVEQLWIIQTPGRNPAPGPILVPVPDPVTDIAFKLFKLCVSASCQQCLILGVFTPWILLMGFQCRATCNNWMNTTCPKPQCTLTREDPGWSLPKPEPRGLGTHYYLLEHNIKLRGLCERLATQQAHKLSSCRWLLVQSPECHANVRCIEDDFEFEL